MEVKLKPMVYMEKNINELLGEGEYRGYHWMIVSRGTHPTAYVEIPEGHYLSKLEHAWSAIDLSEECNGGITYASTGRIQDSLPPKRNWWIGWDYAHVWDYRGNEKNHHNQRMWSTDSIYSEVKKVIDALNIKKIDMQVIILQDMSKEDLKVWIMKHLIPCQIGFRCPESALDCPGRDICWNLGKDEVYKGDTEGSTGDKDDARS